MCMYMSVECIEYMHARLPLHAIYDDVTYVYDDVIHACAPASTRHI